MKRIIRKNPFSFSGMLLGLLAIAAFFFAQYQTDKYIESRPPAEQVVYNKISAMKQAAKAALRGDEFHAKTTPEDEKRRALSASARNAGYTGTALALLALFFAGAGFIRKENKITARIALLCGGGVIAAELFLFALSGIALIAVIVILAAVILSADFFSLC
ncbi:MULTISPECIES: hypothetical protein [Morganella]|jgi:hypothetical protein|uniref:Inner membrane protein yidI n=1 Tax=Morganella morganii TaxID=582 RepID=A0AAN5RZG6_MORMO|nr:hypothetical protein [Morganella morganii]HAT3808629.1 hypothetical protein [Morganella morganii]HED3890948.1 hypothetical protein [Morganella morganii]HEI9843625.1 hypothetical protein [Morganella morganii]